LSFIKAWLFIHWTWQIQNTTIRHRPNNVYMDDKEPVSEATEPLVTINADLFVQKESILCKFYVN
jgi:GTP:adenosylcobinamide-phosphate guanylyltransferase